MVRDSDALDHAIEALAATEPEIREQEVADPVAWRRVWAVGNADFALLNTEEANETGGVGAETLASERWPVDDGVALVDYVPVLTLVGELDGDEVGGIEGDAWPEHFHDLLVSLPAASHLLGGEGGLYVEMREVGAARLFSFEARADEEGPRAPVCVGVRREGELVVGVITGGEEATHEAAALLGVEAEAVEAAEAVSRYCQRPW